MTTERKPVRIYVVEGNHTYWLYTILKHNGYSIDVGHDPQSFGPLSGYKFITIYPDKMEAHYRDGSYGHPFRVFRQAEFDQVDLLENISGEAQMALLLSFGGPSVP